MTPEQKELTARVLSALAEACDMRDAGRSPGEAWNRLSRGLLDADSYAQTASRLRLTATALLALDLPKPEAAPQNVKAPDATNVAQDDKDSFLRAQPESQAWASPKTDKSGYNSILQETLDIVARNKRRLFVNLAGAGVVRRDLLAGVSGTDEVCHVLFQDGREMRVDAPITKVIAALMEG